MYSVFSVSKRAFFIIRSYATDGGGLLFKVFLLSVYSINRHGPGPDPDG
jgi:predicted transcriptional regulator